MMSYKDRLQALVDDADLIVSDGLKTTSGPHHFEITTDVDDVDVDDYRVVFTLSGTISQLGVSISWAGIPAEELLWLGSQMVQLAREAQDLQEKAK